MGWRGVDGRLIRRGELLLSLDFLERYDLELSVLNCGKVGRPYYVSCCCEVSFSVCRIGSLRVLLGPYTGLYLDYTWVRRSIPRLDLRPYMSLRSYIYSR
jgi:hypothetical protein